MLKSNTSYSVAESRPVPEDTGLRCDQTIKLNTHVGLRDCPGKLRRITRFVLSGVRRFPRNGGEVVGTLFGHDQRWKLRLLPRTQAATHRSPRTAVRNGERVAEAPRTSTRVGIRCSGGCNGRQTPCLSAGHRSPPETRLPKRSLRARGAAVRPDSSEASSSPAQQLPLRPRVRGQSGTRNQAARVPRLPFFAAFFASSASAQSASS